MEHKNTPSDRIDFFVGAEMRLDTILSAPDVLPLLKAIIRAGAGFVSITDEKGRFLWTEGAASDPAELQSRTIRALEQGIPKEPGTLKRTDDERDAYGLSPFYHEGEPIGFLFVSMPDSLNGDLRSGLTEIPVASLNTIIRNNVKRLLTTEIHTTVVNQSYEELLESNRQLSIFGKKYKELAETLEKRVEERTAELKLVHTRLLQQEKMASIGQLAAGVAHEINNPIGFIYSNLNTLKKYTGNLIKMLEFYRSGMRGSAAEPAFLKQSEELYGNLKVDLIIGDIHDLLQQSLNGSERIKNIVADLKGFSHIDEAARGEIDINAELDKTISVLSHEIADKAANIIKDYGRIPALYGNPGLLCQVFLNIILNALQSKDNSPAITIRTKQCGEAILISIADDGRGIPGNIRGRIFDPFFTTKDVGKGMGMGLSVAYDIAAAHGGGIEVKSDAGKGSEFIVTLPLPGKTQLHNNSGGE